MDETEIILEAVKGCTEAVRALQNEVANLKSNPVVGVFEHRHYSMTDQLQSSAEYGDTAKGGRGKVKVYFNPSEPEQTIRLVEASIKALHLLESKYGE